MPHAFEPGRPRTLDEFIAALRSLKVAAGSPSITEITRRIHRAWQRTGRPRSEWPARSTVGNCFQAGRRRPNVDLVLAVVDALVRGNVAIVAEWRHALRGVLGAADAVSGPTVSPHLPADIEEFTGRAALLEHAVALFDESARRAVMIDGMAGVGKTTLAVHLAHQLQRRGLAGGAVLAVDLGGIDPSASSAPPDVVLESFLRLLGIPGDRIPSGQEARAALYRRQLIGTRTLVLLDNAASTDQIRSLLPPGNCALLITSRHKLSGLNGVQHLPLGSFTPDEALRLLRNTAPLRHVDADSNTAAEITGLLGYHPLALSIIGRHLRDHPNWTLTDYLEPLTALAMEGGLRAALSLSDRGLPSEPRRLLRLLALHPGRDFDAHAAAALANLTPNSTRRHLDALLAAHLLEPRGRTRYGFHDLVRAYAIERAGIDEPVSSRSQALCRLLQHYRYAAAAATALVRPSGQHKRPPRLAIHTIDFANAQEARTWLLIENANLCAMESVAERPNRQVGGEVGEQPGRRRDEESDGELEHVVVASTRRMRVPACS